MDEELKQILRQRSGIEATSSGNPELDEMKMATKLNEKERILLKRIQGRCDANLKFKWDIIENVKDGNGEKSIVKKDALSEESLANQVMRVAYGATLGFRGLAGRLTQDNVDALNEYGEMLNSFQAARGSKSGLVRSLMIGMFDNLDIVIPKTIAPEDADTDRIVIPTDSAMPFQNLTLASAATTSKDNKPPVVKLPEEVGNQQ